MKQLTTGLFTSRSDAAKAINHIHNKLKIPAEDISFIYRNSEGELKEVKSKKVVSSTPAEGAGKGAVIGGALGALAGIAIVTGLVPVLGAVVATGPIAAALGLAGAVGVGTTTAGILTGAAAGGLIGALANLGVGKEKAQRYEDRVVAGEVLVAVYADEKLNVLKELEECGATDVESFTPQV